jgi:hypothetical protein
MPQPLSFFVEELTYFKCVLRSILYAADSRVNFAHPECLQLAVEVAMPTAELCVLSREALAECEHMGANKPTFPQPGRTIGTSVLPTRVLYAHRRVGRREYTCA